MNERSIYNILICFFLTEELQKQLVEQVELRKKLEREFQNLKGVCVFIFRLVNVVRKGEFWLQNMEWNVFLYFHLFKIF